METITLIFQPTIQLTSEQFDALCRHNPHLQLKLTAEGNLMISLREPVTTGESTN